MEYIPRPYDPGIRNSQVRWGSGFAELFVHLDEDVCRKKANLIRTIFRTQAGNHWFSEEIFLSLLRLRGIESNAPTGYAEAFYSRKAVLG